VRKFSSYGPIDRDLHYYAPREGLINLALSQLLGELPDKGGHYVTVWGARQTGKTWLMQQALFRLQTEQQYARFTAAKINLQHLKSQQDVNKVVQAVADEVVKKLALPEVAIQGVDQFHLIFSRDILKKPLILILDEFDALSEEAISSLVAVFRNIYISRRDQFNQVTEEKDYLLHGVALIGVRAALGVENVTGSPFNVQHSLHIPNLTVAEVEKMFKWYEQESSQVIEPAVVERLFYETQGQPGLTCWLGELLTETYNKNQPTITMRDFKIAYAAALDALPNNNILNIISKAKQEPYKQLVLEIFQTSEKIPFRYDDRQINFLYMNGVIDQEIVAETKRYVKFSCPLVQKRLFNYFAYDLFRQVGQLYDPFESLEDTITDDTLNIENLIRRYEGYLKQNRDRLFKDAPRRSADLRIYEAVYHFNLYMYLTNFLQSYEGQVYPEFPTGNGQIDLIISYAGQTYGIEVKSFANQREYRKALKQAARYGLQLGLAEMSLIFFVDVIDETNRSRYEVVYLDDETGVMVRPLFVETGN
jgi:hypothetical protein